MPCHSSYDMPLHILQMRRPPRVWRSRRLQTRTQLYRLPKPQRMGHQISGQNQQQTGVSLAQPQTPHRRMQLRQLQRRQALGCSPCRPMTPRSRVLRRDHRLASLATARPVLVWTLSKPSRGDDWGAVLTAVIRTIAQDSSFTEHIAVSASAGKGFDSGLLSECFDTKASSKHLQLEGLPSGVAAHAAGAPAEQSVQMDAVRALARRRTGLSPYMERLLEVRPSCCTKRTHAHTPHWSVLM